MERRDNYAVQAQLARERFLSYDQGEIIRKCRLSYDGSYLYTFLFGVRYRIDRENGGIEKELHGHWQDANTFAETLTLFDLLCDSREDRKSGGRYKTMTDFGLMFHRNLLEDRADAFTMLCDRHPQGLQRAAAAYGNRPFPGADVGFLIPVFEDLTMAVQFWHGDEEFAPRVRWLWDVNATMYLRYETMHYALGILKENLRLYFPDEA